MQQTITYIKNGEEITIKVSALNKKYVLTKLFKIYSSNVIVIDTDISLIHFKNISFVANKIKCINIRTICIFENCTFKQSTSQTFKLQWGTFELINPNFIDIDKIEGYLDDFILTISDKNISEQTELSLDITAININLQGNFLLKEIDLRGNNIVLGNEKLPTHIKLLSYSLYRTKIRAQEQLKLNNCVIENLAKKSITIDAENLDIDENSYIKTNGYTKINGTYFVSSVLNPIIITQKDNLRITLILKLKTYSGVLKSKIENLTNKHLRDELQILNEQIELQENNLKELKEKLYIEELNKSKAITKSLSKKSISYFEKNK